MYYCTHIHVLLIVLEAIHVCKYKFMLMDKGSCTCT